MRMKNHRSRDWYHDCLQGMKTCEGWYVAGVGVCIYKLGKTLSFLSKVALTVLLAVHVHSQMLCEDPIMHSVACSSLSE